MKTEYTNQLQREIESYPNDGGIPVIVNSTPPKPTPSSTVDGTHAMIKMACDTSNTDHSSDLKNTLEMATFYLVTEVEPPKALRYVMEAKQILDKKEPSSTVDLEREAELLYPDFIVVNKEGVEENLSIPERKAYIKGRQTSQKGLEDLILELDKVIVMWKDPSNPMDGLHVLQTLKTKATKLRLYDGRKMERSST